MVGLGMAVVACIVLGLPIIVAYRSDYFLCDESIVQRVNTIGLEERQADIQRGLVAGEITEADASLLMVELERMYVSDMESSGSVRVQGQRPGIYRVLALSCLMLLVAIAVYAKIGSFAETNALRTRIENVEPVVSSFMNGLPLSTDVARNTPLADFAMALQIKTQKNPHDSDAWFKLGQLMQTIPLLESAEVAFQRALEEDPQNVDIASQLIQVDLQLNGGTVSAISRRAVAKLQKSNANPVKVQMLAGLVAYRAKELDEAKAIWEGLLGKVNAGDRVVVERSLSLVDEQIRQRSGAVVEPRLIKVHVGISSDLRIKPGMRLFVVAKAMDGSKMPLAVKSYEVVEPTLSLELTNADAMVSGNGLAQHSRVVVEAIVSLNGVAERVAGNWIAKPIVVDFEKQGPWQVELSVDSMLDD